MPGPPRAVVDAEALAINAAGFSIAPFGVPVVPGGGHHQSNVVVDFLADSQCRRQQFTDTGIGGRHRDQRSLAAVEDSVEHRQERQRATLRRDGERGVAIRRPAVAGIVEGP